MKHILFVCTGNTCRSSMAKALMEVFVLQDPFLNNRIKVDSAGVSAYPGQPASPNSIAVLMKLWGIDLSSHSSKQLDFLMVSEADLILTMTMGHKKTILQLYPEAADKVFTLKEFVGGDSQDIQDPFGASEEIYKNCALEINEALERLVLQLKQGTS